MIARALLVLVLLLAFSPPVSAAPPKNYADQGQAFAACQGYLAAALAWTHPAWPPNSHYTNGRCPLVSPGVYNCLVDEIYDGSNYGTKACAYRITEAPESFLFPSTANCATRPPLGGGWFQTGTGPTCKDGCEYGTGPGVDGEGVTFWPGTASALAFKNEQGGQMPTGNTCTDPQEAPKPVTQETCKTVGTLTQCLMPNGKHCAQASTGKKFCWSPTEAGTRVSDNDGATKSPSGLPNNPPPIPPPNNGDWQQTGTGTTSTTHNGNVTNYNTTTYQSTNGGTGSGGGATNPDGSEEPGEGDDDKDANTVSGGSGCAEGGAPTCSGATCTAELFAILIQQWRSRCADDEARNEFGTDATNGAGDAAGDDTGGLLSSLWDNEVTTPSVDYNKVNIGGGLVIPTVTIFDQTWTAPPEFYDALAIIKFIVIAAFSIAGIVVLWNR